MAFRTITIKNRCKLEHQLNYLVVRGEENTRILFDEISVLILANTQISMTAAALSECVNHHIKVIFCDAQWNPQSELVGLHESWKSSESIAKQIGWTKELKDKIWKEIVEEKLKMQSHIAFVFGHEDTSLLLDEYSANVEPGDSTNREGLGAKIYFESIFGLGFNRKNEREERNSFLDYGYSIILSAVNREIAILGYMGQIGLHHIGVSNPFNLGCDFVEPLRPFVDSKLLNNEINKENFKKTFNAILSDDVYVDGKTAFLGNAIRIYIQSLISHINATDNSVPIKFIHPLTYGK